ncbi:MAG: NUDIX hydrolase, partial [Dactylosporangium sp.]|nr:NUDIX hydrolase [Dactylosporangium sp.]
RVLLVRPTYKPYWDIPGGYVQPGESPLAACKREIRASLGNPALIITTEIRALGRLPGPSSRPSHHLNSDAP